MCGIVAYVGSRLVLPLLLLGLQRLEYRGYDSAGVALLGETDTKIVVKKKKGKVSALKDALGSYESKSRCGMGHTRWATHGEPSDMNSHPHSAGGIAVVHNGIIENESVLRRELLNKGVVFTSQTDTEVLAHLIATNMKEHEEYTLAEAVRSALVRVRGTYGIVVLQEGHPEMMVAARNGSPLVVGIGEDEDHKKEYYVASDAAPFIEYTRDVVYLQDGVLASLDLNEGMKTIEIVKNEEFKSRVDKVEWTLEEIEKGGYSDFMLKEIMTQPETLSDCIRGRVCGDSVVLGGLQVMFNGEPVISHISRANRIIFVACGTSWHAGLVGERLFEQFARIGAEVEYASEFRYRNPVLDKENDVVIAISQSGETADTLAAVRLAKENGVLALGICNVVGSTIARETDAGVYLHAGPEIGVASTKAFTAQVAVLTLIALRVADERKTITKGDLKTYLGKVIRIPGYVKQVLDSLRDTIQDTARVFRFASNFLYLGRGYFFPVALEGALKLKEISYIHAEGYAAAEMKHGPIALIDPSMPVVVLCSTKDYIYEKVVSNIREVTARQGTVILVTDEGNHQLDDICEVIFRLPMDDMSFSAITAVIPLQLLSYYVAKLRGCNVDQPRNLAKSVTVE